MKVWEFYSERRKAGAEATNPAHVALGPIGAAARRRFFLARRMWTICTSGPVSPAGQHARRIVQGTLRKRCGRPPVEDHAIYRSLSSGRCACRRQAAPAYRLFGEIPLRWSAFSRR